MGRLTSLRNWVTNTLASRTPSLEDRSIKFDPDDGFITQNVGLRELADHAQVNYVDAWVA